MNNRDEQKLDVLLSRELDPAFARRAKIIAKSLSLGKKEHLLEVGCGRGFYEALLTRMYPNVTIAAIDRKEEYLSQAKQSVSSPQITFSIDDATNLSFRSGTFDRILATEVLEHIPDDKKALQEFYRTLKKGGIAVFTVPNKQYPFLWDPVNWILERLFGIHIPSHIWFAAGIWADHVRLYSEDELVEKCTDAGFVVEKIWRSTKSCIPFTHFLLYGIGKNIVEKGLLPAFHRFSWEAKPTPFMKAIRAIIYAVDDQNGETEKKGVATMNLIIKVKKL